MMRPGGAAGGPPQGEGRIMTAPSQQVNQDRLKKFFERDRLARALGCEIVDVGPGRARIRMPVREEQYNAVNILHGGAIFTLADFAFAVASNSHGEVAVAINVSISYIKAVSAGTLIAEAEEIARSRRLGTYSVRVLDESGAIVAMFQGTVYRKGDPITFE